MKNESLEVVLGRLGNDPYLSYTGSGTPICNMSIGLKDPQNETFWRKVVVFGKLAELCKVHLKKGNEIFVRGQIELKKFVNREGHDVEYFEIKAVSIGQSLL